MEENKDNKIDLIKYLDTFAKSCFKLKLPLMAIIIASVLFFLGKTYFTFETTYSSKAVFIPSITEQKDIYQVNDSSSQLAERFATLVTGPIMSTVITESLQTPVVPGNIDVSLIPDTNLIELKVVSTNAEDAYNVVNSIINNYDKATNDIMNDVKLFVLDTPKLATKADAQPNYFKTVMKGAVVGLVFGLVIVCIYAFLRHTINNSEDVKNNAHLKFIATIPYMKVATTTDTDVSSLVLTTSRAKASFKKPFTDICLRIEKEYKDSNAKVFVISSTLPNEGKSMVSTNAAIALANKGYKVVLVDVDLRNPSIKKLINEKAETASLVDYLKKKITFDSLITTSTNYPMDVIFGSNQSEDDASELIDTKQFEQLIEKLRDHYDFIILDVPPLQMMEDASLVAKHADRGIVVIKQDYAKDYEIIDAVGEFMDNSDLVIGAILNQVKPSLFDEETSKYGYGSYGGYGYGSRYGYGYGYGYGKDK